MAFIALLYPRNSYGRTPPKKVEYQRFKHNEVLIVTLMNKVSRQLVYFVNLQ